METKPNSSPTQAQTGGQRADGAAGTPVHLPVTLGTELIAEIVNLNLRIRSVLAGMDGGRFLLIKLSPNDLMGTFRSEMVTRSPVIVKFQYKDTVYAFNSEVLNIVSNPCKLMFLAYPAKVEEFKVWPDSRHECVLPAMAMLDNEILEMVIIDISREGCQCFIKAPGARGEALNALIHVNTDLDIRAQFPGTEERFRFTGKVRNISRDVDKIKIGVMFEKISPEVKAKIDGFIALISEIKTKG
ncbi:MAG: PilZ domain-containing protein [Deltaproteobacteria bacterium]|nr:PilZ domain-containing protein [Deltaproteobacteria bacterium]